MGLNWNRLDKDDKWTMDRSDLKNYKNIIANDANYNGGEQALAA